jgi:phage terminase small subunit
MGKATTDHPALVGLTEKRRRFVLAYVGEAMGNASEAARIAGYTHPGQQGHDALKNLEVAAAIRALAAPAEKRAIATSEELRERLTSIAMGKASDLEARASDVVAAAKLLLTVSGDLVKRVERVDQPKSRAELVARLEETLAKLRSEG